MIFLCTEVDSQVPRLQSFWVKFGMSCNVVFFPEITTWKVYIPARIQAVVIRHGISLPMVEVTITIPNQLLPVLSSIGAKGLDRSWFSLGANLMPKWSSSTLEALRSNRPRVPLQDPQQVPASHDVLGCGVCYLASLGLFKSHKMRGIPWYIPYSDQKKTKNGAVLE